MPKKSERGGVERRRFNWGVEDLRLLIVMGERAMECSAPKESW